MHAARAMNQQRKRREEKLQAQQRRASSAQSGRSASRSPVPSMDLEAGGGGKKRGKPASKKIDLAYVGFIIAIFGAVPLLVGLFITVPGLWEVGLGLTLIGLCMGVCFWCCDCVREPRSDQLNERRGRPRKPRGGKVEDISPLKVPQDTLFENGSSKDEESNKIVQPSPGKSKSNPPGPDLIIKSEKVPPVQRQKFSYTPTQSAATGRDRDTWSSVSQDPSDSQSTKAKTISNISGTGSGGVMLVKPALNPNPPRYSHQDPMGFAPRVIKSQNLITPVGIEANTIRSSYSLPGGVNNKPASVHTTILKDVKLEPVVSVESTEEEEEEVAEKFDPVDPPEEIVDPIDPEIKELKPGEDELELIGNPEDNVEPPKENFNMDEAIAEITSSPTDLNDDEDHYDDNNSQKLRNEEIIIESSESNIIIDQVETEESSNLNKKLNEDEEFIAEQITILQQDPYIEFKSVELLELGSELPTDSKETEMIKESIKPD